jgi:lipoprotein-anchoring transpeptidase ErfK/SrfK
MLLWLVVSPSTVLADSCPQRRHTHRPITHAEDPTPTPAPSVEQKRIEVNLTTQHLTAWEGERKVFEFAVTTGQEGQETLTGEFEILDKELEPWSSAWNLQLPFWLGIYQVGEFENGFHALPLDEAGEELWGEALGQYPASHGCIVLARADAEALYDWAEIGTRVEIHD